MTSSRPSETRSRNQPGNANPNTNTPYTATPSFRARTTETRSVRTWATSCANAVLAKFRPNFLESASGSAGSPAGAEGLTGGVATVPRPTARRNNSSEEADEARSNRPRAIRRRIRGAQIRGCSGSDYIRCATSPTGFVTLRLSSAALGGASNLRASQRDVVVIAVVLVRTEPVFGRTALIPRRTGCAGQEPSHAAS